MLFAKRSGTRIVIRGYAIIKRRLLSSLRCSGVRGKVVDDVAFRCALLQRPVQVETWRALRKIRQNLIVRCTRFARPVDVELLWHTWLLLPEPIQGMSASITATCKSGFISYLALVEDARCAFRRLDSIHLRGILCRLPGAIASFIAEIEHLGHLIFAQRHA